MRVLIVDDTKIMRTTMGSIIEKLGHEVIYMAEDGQDAVNAYKEHTPDLVTMDINMPKMSGLVALEHIMEIDDDAKVLMVTSNGLEQAVLRSIKEGALGYILKPIRIDCVRDAIHKIFPEDSQPNENSQSNEDNQPNEDSQSNEDGQYDEDDFFQEL